MGSEFHIMYAAQVDFYLYRQKSRNVPGESGTGEKNERRGDVKKFENGD